MVANEEDDANWLLHPRKATIAELGVKVGFLLMSNVKDFKTLDLNILVAIVCC